MMIYAKQFAGGADTAYLKAVTKMGNLDSETEDTTTATDARLFITYTF